MSPIVRIDMSDVNDVSSSCYLVELYKSQGYSVSEIKIVGDGHIFEIHFDK